MLSIHIELSQKPHLTIARGIKLARQRLKHLRLFP